MTSELYKSKIIFNVLRGCLLPFALNTNCSFRQNILSHFNVPEKTRKKLDVANISVALLPVIGC